jgi:hypothetical protein
MSSAHWKRHYALERASGTVCVNPLNYCTRYHCSPFLFFNQVAKQYPKSMGGVTVRFEGNSGEIKKWGYSIVTVLLAV